jgi:Zn finger protein HypA/HybF involved in hydrogenase expression
MHEFGLCEALLRAVEKRAAGRRVTGVRVRIGTAHAVEEPALAQSFAMVAMGGCAAGAELELVTVPGEEFTLESIRVVQEGDPGEGPGRGAGQGQESGDGAGEGHVPGHSG